MDTEITCHDNMLTVAFAERPPQATLRDMRTAGFNWSQSRRAWRRAYSREAEQTARAIAARHTQETNALFFETAVNSILHGDCLRVLPELPESCVDFVLTDPPYLVNYRDRSGRSIRNDHTANWVNPAFAQIARLMKPDSLMLCFYGWQSVDTFMAAWRASGLRPVGHIVAAKGYASSRGYFDHVHEQAYLLAKGHPPKPADTERLEDIRRWKYTGNRHHPTEKPVGLLRDLLVSFCPAGGLVLDPFAGSGSSCIAARSAGRRFIGIEIDPAYHTAAIGRLSGDGAA